MRTTNGPERPSRELPSSLETPTPMTDAEMRQAFATELRRTHVLVAEIGTLIADRRPAEEGDDQ